MSETTKETYTAEEYNQLKTEGENGVQVLNERYDYIISNRDELVKDPSKVKEIYEGDKKLGKLILEKLYDGKSIDDIVVEDESEEDTSQNIDQIVERKLQQQKVADKVDAVVSKLPEDQREAFIAEYKDLTAGRDLTPKNVTKYLKYALDGVLGDTDIDTSSIKAQALGGGMGGGATKTAKERKTEARVSYAQLLREGKTR